MDTNISEGHVASILKVEVTAMGMHENCILTPENRGIILE
jgi:hypothetical protein